MYQLGSSIKAAVIGYGYWGKHIARNLSALLGPERISIVDTDSEARKRAAQDHPSSEISDAIDALLVDEDIQLVAIVTPVVEHFSLALRALQSGKHIFVEKPFTLNYNEAALLAAEAAARNLHIMVDHTWLFHPELDAIKKLVDAGDLGKLVCYDAVRSNLGLCRNDVNVLYDLAPHDVSILLYLIDKDPLEVHATGFDCLGQGTESVAWLTLVWPAMVAHINLSWLGPEKTRTVTLCGNRRMLVWNNLEPHAPVRVHDKGVDICCRDEAGTTVHYRNGAMQVPAIEEAEALEQELRSFIDCIQSGQPPVRNSATDALRVMRVLEAAAISLKKSRPCRLEDVPLIDIEANAIGMCK